MEKLETREIYWPHAAQSLSVLVNPETKKRLYLQNWKGLIFRVFGNVKQLSNCLKNRESECIFETESEEALDEFLQTNN